MTPCMTFRFSISLKLLVLILPLICLPIATVGYFSYQASVERVDRLVRHEQMVQVKATAAAINDIFYTCRLDLVTIASGTNIFADAEDHFETELEELLSRNPSVILASFGHGAAADSPVGWAQTDERLAETDARIDGRIYEIDADIVTRPGPRAIDGLETIARFLHPNLFATTE